MAQSPAPGASVALQGVPRISLRENWWVAVALALLIAAVVSHNLWFLNWTHVFAGLLWTGTDLFMGFVLGPIMRRVDLPVRRAILLRLTPRMLFIMPTLSIVTTTAGWFLASDFGYLSVPFPQRWWIVAALVIAALLTVQGLGILLPTNLRIYFELRRERPDAQKMQRMMRRYFGVVALQGAMQVAIIIIMSRLATGV